MACGACKQVRQAIVTTAGQVVTGDVSQVSETAKLIASTTKTKLASAKARLASMRR